MPQRPSVIFRYSPAPAAVPVLKVADVVAVFEVTISKHLQFEVAMLQLYEQVYAGFPCHPIAACCQYLYLSHSTLALALPNEHFVDKARLALDYAHAAGFHDATRGIADTHVGLANPVPAASDDVPRFLLMPA